jgi:pimeloyl-ACP methyl ester carboxylesterase
MRPSRAPRWATTPGPAPTEDLAAVSAPVLRIWGADDRVVPPPAAGAHQVIAGTGHIPQMEAPAKVAALLNAHMEASE